MEFARTILVSVMRTISELIVHLNAVSGTATIKVHVTTQMEFVSVILHFSETFVNTKNALMTALAKDFAINLKENAFATINGMETTARKKNVLITALEKDNVLMEFVSAQTNFTVPIALKEIVLIIAIHMDFARTGNAFVMRDLLENTVSIELVRVNAASKEYVKKMVSAFVTRVLLEMTVLLLIAQIIVTIMVSAEITLATAKINGQELIVLKSLVLMTAQGTEYVNKELVIAKMDS